MQNREDARRKCLLHGVYHVTRHPTEVGAGQLVSEPPVRTETLASSSYPSRRFGRKRWQLSGRRFSDSDHILCRTRVWPAGFAANARRAYYLSGGRLLIGHVVRQRGPRAVGCPQAARVTARSTSRWRDSSAAVSTSAERSTRTGALPQRDARSSQAHKWLLRSACRSCPQSRDVTPAPRAHKRYTVPVSRSSTAWRFPRGLPRRDRRSEAGRGTTSCCRRSGRSSSGRNRPRHRGS